MAEKSVETDEKSRKIVKKGYVQNRENLECNLAKSHNKKCEILLLFSFCKNGEKRAKNSENINYKQNVRKKIVCKNIT